MGRAKSLGDPPPFLPRQEAGTRHLGPPGCSEPVLVTRLRLPMVAGRCIVAEAWETNALKHRIGGFRIWQVAKWSPCSGGPPAGSAQTSPESCSQPPVSASRLVGASTELKLPHQGGCPPTKAKMLFSASVSHSRKPANSRLLWEPDKDKDDADKGGSGQTQSRHRDNSSPLRALPPKRSPGWS